MSKAAPSIWQSVSPGFFTLVTATNNTGSVTTTYTRTGNTAFTVKTSATVNGTQQFVINYDPGAQGKINQKTNLGDYKYDATRIHQLKYLTQMGGAADPTVIIGTDERNITYTAFLKTATITENNYQITYTYGSDRQRIKSELKQNGTTIETKLYWGDMEKLTKGSTTYEVYYIAAGNGLNNIIIKQGSSLSIYYAYTDQIGSSLDITNEAGVSNQTLKVLPGNAAALNLQGFNRYRVF